jgi:nucleotide-binding universal stress UspA family protein
MREPFSIVGAVDQSEYAEIVLEHALDQANRHDDLDLHIVTVDEDRRRARPRTDRAPDPGLKSWLRDIVVVGLDTFGGGERPGRRVRLHVRVGDPADEIASLAAEVEASLIVIGRFGLHGGRHGGSVAEQVLRQAVCPALIVQLTQRAPRDPTLCRDCVAVRRESRGERWFCAAHSDNAATPLGIATTLLPVGGSGIGGTTMW